MIYKLFILLIFSVFCLACFDSGQEETQVKAPPAVTGSIRPENSTDGNSATSPEPTSAPSSAPTNEGAEKLVQVFDTKKWNTYVDLNNDLEERFYPALQNYFKAFGNSLEYQPADNPADIEDFITAMSATGQLSKDIEKALSAAKNPRTNLDEATGEMAASLKILWDTMHKSRDYHLSPDSTETHQVAAQEAHTNIYESYQAFEASYANFMKILNEQDAERRKEDLADMRAKGLAIRPAMLQLVDDAQAIQDLLNSQGITSVTLPSLKLESFLSLYETYMVNMTQYTMTLDDAAQPGREGLDSVRLADFTLGVQAVKISADNLIQRHKDKARVEDLPELHIGTPENYSYELGQLVNLYNSVIH